MHMVCLLLQILEALFEQRDLTEQETTSAIEVRPGLVPSALRVVRVAHWV